MIALNLTIRRKWLDLIRIGTKKEEYRTCRDNVAERYDASEFFIKFPRALPIELKGIAV